MDGGLVALIRALWRVEKRSCRLGTCSTDPTWLAGLIHADRDGFVFSVIEENGLDQK